MARRDRRILGALIAVLGIALGAVLAVLFGVHGTAQSNTAELRRQQAVTERLAQAVEAAQSDASTQRLLVQALQRQVRALHGEPLTEPPTTRTLPGSTPRPTTPAGSTPRATPSPTSSATPRPSPRPTPSPSPRPSPTSSLCAPVIGCVPRGSH